MPEETTMTTPADYNRVLSESLKRKDLIRSLRQELAQKDEQIKGLTAERDEYAEALVSLGDSHDELEAKVNAAPDELQAKIQELEAQILSRDRTAEFHKLAKEKGIKDEHFEDVIKLMGWKPDAEDHDPAKLGESIDGLVGRFPLFKGDVTPANPTAATSGGGAAQTPRAAPRPAGPGVNRGGLPTAARETVDSQLAERYPNPSRLA